MDSLVEALTAQQEAEGLGNNAFARRLGVDKGTWSNVRRGLMAPSAAVYSAALRVYPDLVIRVAQVLEISNEIDVSDPQPSRVAS